MASTLKTIAKRSGMSIATVSLALKGDQRVAEKTRKKIQKLATSFAYVPSNLGRALQSRKSRLVGYLLHNVTASFLSEIMQGIGEIATENGYGLLVAITDGSTEREANQLRLFQEKRVDGIIVSKVHHESWDRLLELEKSGLPIVFCSCDSFHRRIPNVITNNKKGGAMAAEHLIELGHQRLAYCFGYGGEHLRYQGCMEAARHNGMMLPALCKTEEDLVKLLGARGRPTGIVAYTDLDTLRVKHVAESVKLRIPDDLSVVGFDDIWLASLPEFQFTTIAQPKREIGRLSMEMLLRRISGQRVRRKRLTPTLVVRHSTAPPKKSRAP